MGLQYLYTLDDFEYDGIRIPIMVHHERESGDNPLFRVEFEYKDCRVFDWYYRDEKVDAYSLTRIYCRIIDKYGPGEVEKFKECKEKLGEIKKKYILIDSKIYKFNKNIVDIHPHKIHLMHLKMADGTKLDGDSIMNHDIYIKEKDSYSYRKTLDNLRCKAQDYFNCKKVLPCEEHFLEDKTKEYSELLIKYQEFLK